ncbi:hypothetical protein MMC30_003377 [Trapelia coarctata]|nr:hypothetical protein [Trapelia coarctata]
MTSDFLVFEQTGWEVLLGYPRMLAQDMHATKKSLLEAFTSYYSLPPVQRSDSSWFFETQSGEMNHLGFEVNDVASIAVLYYWVVNANAYKICFWILVHMVYHLDLLTAVRAETAPACNPDGTFDMDQLLSNCSRLDAIWDEVLRVYNNVVVVHKVMSPIVLGGKNLHPGDTVLSPFRQFHLDRNVYGEDILNFRHDRFLKGKLTAGAKNFRSFGGRHTHCPGRFLARREVYVLVALDINRFEIQLDSSDGPQAFPIPDQKKPNLGAMAPTDGYDLVVNVTPK